MPLVKEGDAEGLQQLKNFVSTLTFVSAVAMYNEWGVIDKLINLEVLGEDWAPYSDNSFRHYVIYATTAAGVVLRMSRSQLGLGISFPSGGPDDDEHDDNQEWKARPGTGVNGSSLHQAFDAHLGQPFSYILNNCRAFAVGILAAFRNGASAPALTAVAPTMPPSQVQVSPVTWLPPGAVLDPGLLVGNIKLRGLNHHSGLETHAFIQSVQGVLRAFAPSATVIEIRAGCIEISFYILCGCLGAALAQMRAVATIPFLPVQLMGLIAGVHTPVPPSTPPTRPLRYSTPPQGRSRSPRGSETSLASTPGRRDRLKKLVYEVIRQRGQDALEPILAELDLDMNNARNFRLDQWEALARRFDVRI